MILVVDDNRDIAEVHGEMISGLGYKTKLSSRPEEVLPLLRDNKDIDLIFLDIRMPRIDGMVLLQDIRQNFPTVGVVMATVVNDIKLAIQAIKNGAYNYLLKPLQVENVDRVIRSYFKNQPKSLGVDPRFCAIITRHEPFREIFRRIEAFSSADMPVLIQGETGTGKELIARQLHRLGGRSDNPFVPVNVAALSKDIFHAEMFGHTRGSFTGAQADRRGFFEQARGGSLFLDEIGELSPALQGVFLRVLQDGSYYPVGSSEERKADARIILATNRDLKDEVTQGRFREDLYYRICSATIQIPALRERPEDIELLADYFLKKYVSQHGRRITGFHSRTLQQLADYSFPGNVRELEGIINSSVLLCQDILLMPRDLPEHLQENQADKTPEAGSFHLESLKHQAITKALRSCGGNQSRAAELLGISRATLVRFLSEKRR